MCKLEIFIDRYADKVDEEWRICHFCPQGRPWECRKYYEDEIIEHVQGPRTDMPSRSSDNPIRTSPIGAPSTDAAALHSPGSRRRPSRREPRPFTGLVLDALVGGRRRPRRKSESRIRTSEVVIEGRIPSVYPSTPSPTFRTSYESSHRFSPSPVSPRSPMTPRFSESWEADIVDASPMLRGRRGTPVIVENGRSARRSDSTEVHSGRSAAPSRDRSSSADYRYVRQREEQRTANEERRRLRDLREAQLEQEIAQGRADRERQHEIELHNAEIQSRRPRPVVQQSSPPRRRGILRNGSTRRTGTDSIVEELQMSARGEQVLREAIAARARERVQIERESVATERERADAELRRLGRRFERVVYVDEPYGRRQ